MDVLTLGILLKKSSELPGQSLSCRRVGRPEVLEGVPLHR